MSAGLLSSLWRAARVTLRSLSRVARQLFHEATGTLFALFAFYGGVAAWRQWNHGRTFWLAGLAILYALMMAGFSFLAFRSSRRIR